MNLLEAIRAGDEFYRESWIDRRPITRAELGKLSEEALLADDWNYIADIQLTITPSDFDEAVKRTDARVTTLFKHFGVNTPEYIKLFKEELFK
jgi:hypothetical protein